MDNVAAFRGVPTNLSPDDGVLFSFRGVGDHLDGHHRFGRFATG
ncbi:hypothetical protein ACX80D_03100 [Arthrobacter sp. Sr24]